MHLNYDETNVELICQRFVLRAPMYPHSNNLDVKWPEIVFSTSTSVAKRTKMNENISKNY